MPINTNKPSAGELETALAMAEAALEEAQHTADLLRVARAREVLSEAFPDHGLAVFVRDWDEDAPRLVQLLSSQEGVEDIDLTQNPPTPLPKGASKAFREAKRTIQRIADDNRLHAQLDMYGEGYEKYHDGWVEFDLPLAAAEAVNRDNNEEIHNHG